MHIHKWSNWEKITYITPLDQFTDGQERKCIRCGKIERERLW